MKTLFGAIALLWAASTALYGQTAKNIYGSWELQEQFEPIFTFEKDGKLTILEKGEATTINWSFNETTKEVLLELPDGDRESFRVVQYSKNELVIASTAAADSDPLQFKRLAPAPKPKPVSTKSLIGKWLPDEAKGGGGPSGYIQLNKDGSLAVQEFDQVITGNWTYSAKENVLKFSSPMESDTLYFKVAAVSKTSLELIQNADSYPREVYLIKEGAKPKTEKTKTAKNDLKPLPAKSVRLTMIGTWNAHSMTMIGDLSNAGLSLQLILRQDGTVELSENGDPKTGQWTLSDDSKFLTLSHDGAQQETWGIELYGKDILLMDIGGMKIIWLREGAAEPKKLPNIDVLPNDNPDEDNMNEEGKLKRSPHANFDKILGKWQLVSIDGEDLVEANIVIHLHGEKEGFVIETYEQGVLDKEGYWKMDDLGTGIRISEADGSEYHYFGNELRIEELDSHTLILIDNEQRMVLKRQ